MTEPTNYRVSWEIDVLASSPEEAAREARAAQTRPGTMATVFTVQGEGFTDPVAVDLTELDGAAPAPTFADRLRALIAEGLTIGETLNVFGEHQAATDPGAQAFIDAAPDRDGISYDATPIVSQSDDGAYVSGWVWVSNEAAGLEPDEEGEGSADA